MRAKFLYTMSDPPSSTKTIRKTQSNHEDSTFLSFGMKKYYKGKGWFKDAYAHFAQLSCLLGPHFRIVPVVGTNELSWRPTQQLCQINSTRLATKLARKKFNDWFLVPHISSVRLNCHDVVTHLLHLNPNFPSSDLNLTKH